MPGLPPTTPIDAQELAHLAHLARLELTPDESVSLLADLNTMLGYFEQLGALDTAGVPEMQRPVPLVNVLRPDVEQPAEMFSQPAALRLAPAQRDGFIEVPRTVEG